MKLNERIAAASRRVQARANGMKPETLISLLRGMASRTPGSGPGQIDPVERVLVRHRLEVAEEQLKADRLAKEHEQLTRMPPKHMPRSQYLAKLEELDRHKQLAMARAVDLSERSLAPEFEEAAKVYAAEETRAERASAIMAAAEARADALTERQDEAAEMAAKAIAARRG